MFFTEGHDSYEKKKNYINIRLGEFMKTKCAQLLHRNDKFEFV